MVFFVKKNSLQEKSEKIKEDIYDHASGSFLSNSREGVNNNFSSNTNYRERQKED